MCSKYFAQKTDFPLSNLLFPWFKVRSIFGFVLFSEQVSILAFAVELIFSPSSQVCDLLIRAIYLSVCLSVIFQDLSPLSDISLVCIIRIIRVLYNNDGLGEHISPSNNMSFTRQWMSAIIPESDMLPTIGSLKESTQFLEEDTDFQDLMIKTYESEAIRHYLGEAAWEKYQAVQHLEQQQNKRKAKKAKYEGRKGTRRVLSILSKIKEAYCGHPGS